MRNNHSQQQQRGQGNKRGQQQGQGGMRGHQMQSRRTQQQGGEQSYFNPEHRQQGQGQPSAWGSQASEGWEEEAGSGREQRDEEPLFEQRWGEDDEPFEGQDSGGRAGTYGSGGFGQSGGYGQPQGQSRGMVGSSWAGQRGSGGGGGGESYGQGSQGAFGHGGYGSGTGHFGRQEQGQGSFGGMGPRGEPAWSGMGQQQQQQRYPRGPKGYKRSDERIKEDVSDRISQMSMVDSSDVEVEVKNGEVTLTGTIPNRNMKWQLESMVESVGGVTDVHNQLRVKREEGSSLSSSLRSPEEEKGTRRPSSGMSLGGTPGSSQNK